MGDSTDDLRLLLASRHPVIAAEADDEQRLLGVLREAAGALGLPVWVWSATRGLVRDGSEPAYQTAEPLKALQFVSNSAAAGVFVFADVEYALADPVVVRQLKEIGQGARPGRTLVLAGPRRTMPAPLEGVALSWTLEPPGREEIEAMVRRTIDDLAVRSLPISLTADEVSGLVDAVRGLTLPEAERLILRAALKDGRLSGEDLAFVRGAKAELLEADGILELIETDLGDLEEVGGVANLKGWLAVRGRAFEPAAAEFGLDPPRGVLLTGVPGCGKSLVAKTLARTWGLPLVLLDPARLYGPYVGESESRLRAALDTIGAMAPIVLWIDELEKGFAAGRGDGDSGVSRRVLGSFLRWMQDRPGGVFLVATCNDVATLPPELLRRGRFDEVFFVDLPDRDAREQILAIQLRRRRRDPAGFDLAALAEAAEGFSGAELEGAVVAAMYRAYADGEDLTTERIRTELAATAPLSRTKAEDIARLRAWAADRAVAA